MKPRRYVSLAHWAKEHDGDVASGQNDTAGSENDEAGDAKLVSLTAVDGASPDLREAA